MSKPNETNIAWWIKHKNQIYAAGLLIVGILGGNADRVSTTLVDMVPDSMQQSFADMDNKITVLESEVADLKQENELLDAILFDLDQETTAIMIEMVLLKDLIQDDVVELDTTTSTVKNKIKKW